MTTNRFHLPVALLAAFALPPAALAANTCTITSCFGINLFESTTTGGIVNYASETNLTNSYPNAGLDITDLHGSVTPSTFAPGLNAGTLQLTGGSTANAYAAASLPQRTLLADTTGPIRSCGGSCTTTGLQAEAQPRLVDTLHLRITNGAGSAPVTVQVHMAGAYTFSSATNSLCQFSTSLSFNGASFQYLGSQTNGQTPVFGPTSVLGAWVSQGFTNQSAAGFDFVGVVNVTNGLNTIYTLNLDLQSNGGVVDSFSNPANPNTLTFIFPSNVTVTSDATASAGFPRDFRGIGRTDEVLYDPSLGQEYTALSNGDGTYQYPGNLFTPGFDTLRTGDFNGDGKTDLVLYNSHTALAYIGMGNGDGTFTFQSLFWSPGYDIVEAGDLDGDGKTDFALYNSVTGTMYTAISNGTGTFTYKYTLISKGYTVLRLADFTGDGKADLFVYNVANGSAYLGTGDGSGGFSFNALFISPGYSLADIGDLNGDGKADLILYNGTNGNAATGISNGAGGFAFTPLVFSPGFTSVRLADYTGDGLADVTVYNSNNANAYFGTGNGAGNFTFQSLFWSPGYNFVIPADVNGDGKIDVVLYNSTVGTEYTGISNGNGTFNYTYQYWGIGKSLAR